MFIAEDRIMCFHIVAQPNSAYILSYIPGATAITDPPLSFFNFLKQRRRWINGANATYYHIATSCPNIFKSNHALSRKLALFFYFIA